VIQVETGKIIKEKRTAKNMTQEELANELFVSRPLISKWENERSYPDLEQLLKLSDFFDLTLDELMRGDKKMIKKKDSQVRVATRGIRVMLIILILIALYFSFIQIKKNNLYKNIKKDNWQDEGISFVLRDETIQYNIYKIKTFNIFSIPKTLPLVAVPINSVGERAIIGRVILHFDGDKENFYINWMDGDLRSQVLNLDSSFTYKKELQPLQKQDLSYEFEKIFNKELEKEGPFLEPFLKEVDKKWKEVNK